MAAGRATSRTADVEADELPDFSELSISDAVARGLRDAGFLRPSPIQAAAIPLGRFGIDLIARAKSGTGKTAAFAVVALEGVAPGRGGPQALLVSPTREIALQTAGVCRAIGGHLRSVRVGAFIGGTRMRNDEAIAAACEVACGTPGRLVGLLMAEAMIGERVRILVLDEADK
jgi:ATP-dependent RNA helicase DDX20